MKSPQRSPFHRIKAKAGSWKRRALRAYHDRRGRISVSIDKLLLGDESGLPAAKVAVLFGSPTRPSTPMLESPHVLLLENHKRLGDGMFVPETLRQTAYYKNALLNLDIFGHYFGAKSEDQLPQQIRRFVDHAQGKSADQPRQNGQSPSDSPIRVRPVKHSSYFQVVDGHHRIAIAHARGEQNVPVVAAPMSVLTPMQERLLDVLWLGGRKELYQPIDLPEVQEEWILVRKCADRIHKIQQFLGEKLAAPGPEALTYCDLGSSYGWFVAEMAHSGFDAFGVERDPIAASIGHIVYSLPKERIFRSDMVRFLRETDRRFDVVSCFSVLHHFHMADCGTSPDEVMRLIDRLTGRVLFFDMGHEGEKWFSQRLAGWTQDRIEAWLKKSTSFREVVRLGIDEDAVPPFQENYSRMLFACLR